MNKLIFVLLLILLYILISSSFIENFPYNIPILNGYTDLPWNNMMVGTKSNMSYDLRGDPIIIPHVSYPWNNPETYPIYNPPI